MTAITPEIVAEHGLSPDEYQRILAALGRAPNLLELGIFSVMWSEHCSYKSTRLHLAKLPTDAPWVIQGPGENAGVIAIGADAHGHPLAAVFKMESHNHPSFIEPTQGAATGVGGIMRDVFTMGARPVALLNALSFGAPDHPKTRHLVKGVVAGIGGYGNCVGVPTVGGEIRFHPRYNGNILVNAMCVGIARADRIFRSAAAGVGNPVIYVGSRTGRDGIHGATMASAEFGEDADAKRPTVQVGDPFLEKLLIEACLELMATDAIVAIQDMGAAGLTSSSVEMASKGGVGIRLDLDRVPAREAGMTPYEFMLSESQERMLMVLKPGREPEAEAIFRKWGLEFAVIGEITGSGRLELCFHGEQVADLPLGPLSDGAPKYDRPRAAPQPPPPLGAFDPSTDPSADLLTLLASPDLASRRWVFEQYDHMVGADTIIRPGADAALVRVHGTRLALAMTTDVTPRYCAADPVEGGRQAVAETWRNLSAVGATPLAITNCLNFAAPTNPAVMGELVGCLEGMSDACRALDYPVVSGNVSLYNESRATGGGAAIPPTPSIGGVGLIDDWAKAATPALKAPGEGLWLIGGAPAHLGQSLWLRECRSREAGPPPPVDLAAERLAGDWVRRRIHEGALTAVHDISDGGLLVALAEMVMASRFGARIALPPGTEPTPFLFGEDQGRYLITAAADTRLDDCPVPLLRLGSTTATPHLVVEGHLDLPAETLRTTHESFFPALMGWAGNSHRV
ncbi:phosphoribosylformylglycinamidine synthase subunit PurL [Thermaurantiacus sp.]